MFDLLEYLIRNRDRVVTRDDVFTVVWHGRSVSEAALNTRINATRTAINDDGANQRLIKTIRTRGFRFVGAVREEETSTSPRSRLFEDDRRLHPISLLGPPRIAILPFANITGDRRQEPLADGLTEELITALSKVGWLFVASHASSFACKGRAIDTRQIARKLGVRYVLEGSIRVSADCARIAVQLVDGLLDHQIWAERYDKKMTHDIFTVHTDICDKVVTSIEPQLYLAELVRAERTKPENLGSWECIVRALALMNTRDRTNAGKAVGLLRKASSIECESAQAHSLLSIITTFRLHMGWTNRRAAVPIALSSAHKALSMNADEPWAQAALGYALIWKNPEEALLPCMRAVALNPNFAVGHYFLALASAYAGECNRIFPHADKAERLARRDLLAHGYAGAHSNVRSTGCFALENYKKGAEFARKAIADTPASPTAYRAFTMNLALAGKLDEARRALQTLRRLAPEISQEWIKQNAVWVSDDAMKRYIEAFHAAGLK